MFAGAPIKEVDSNSSLDSTLLNICTPNDGIINLIELEEILKKGVNPNLLHSWSAFANCYAEHQSRFPLLQRIATAKNAIDAAELLLKYGADLTIVDPHTGNTVLHTAIAVKNETYILFLIDKIKNNPIPDVNKLINQQDTKSDWRNTPLILAFKKGLEKVVNTLIDVGADVNIADRYNTTPLHWAALVRYDEIIEKMSKLGANPHQATKYNHTALELYQYEFGLLDFQRKLEYRDSFGSVKMITNLPELSDNHFHGGIHRKKQPPNEYICHLLATKSQGIPLSEQYLQNFITQDAIARSAICVFGHEYSDSILPVLKIEEERLYGTKHNLPNHAGEGMFQRRSNPPNFDVTRMQIINTMRSFKEQKEIPQDPIRPNTTSQATKQMKEKKTNSSVFYSHPLLIKPVLFTSTINTPPIPANLQHILNDSGMVKNCLTKGFVSVERLIGLHEKTPYVVDALRCSNIYQGVCNGHITIEQLGQLTEQQVSSIEFKFKDTELAIKVKDYIEHNLLLRNGVT